jgi:gliding motility-associated-like protein
VIGVHTGTATITYDHSGCWVTTVITVDATPDAGVITGPGVLCIGASITLSDTAIGTWSSVNTAVASISSSGTLHGVAPGDAVIVYTTPANSAGCFDTAMYTVTVDSPSFRIFDTLSNVSCYGGHDGRIAIFVDRPIPYSYTWSNGGGPTSIDSLTIGTYSLMVTDTISKCYKTASYTITQPDSLIASVVTAPDSCFAGSGRATLTVSGGVLPYQYLWNNSAATDEVAGLMPGTYSVAVTDSHSCAVHIEAIVSEDSCFEIRIYDVITPNADGVNDVWVIEGLNRYPQNTVQIFDKWGDLVYERSNYNNEWYGQGRGSALLPDGTYFYLVKLNARNRMGGENVFKGTVLIKR